MILTDISKSIRLYLFFLYIYKLIDEKKKITKNKTLFIKTHSDKKIMYRPSVTIIR